MADTKTRPRDVCTEQAVVELFSRPRGEVKNDLAAGRLRVRAVLRVGTERLPLIDYAAARSHYRRAANPGAVVTGMLPDADEIAARAKAMRRTATVMRANGVAYRVMHPGAMLLAADA